MTPRYDLPLANLAWPVPEAGYRWESGGKKTMIGTEILVPVERDPARMTDPAVEQPALYRLFAGTPVTKEGVRGFANGHGTLGVTIDAQATHEGCPWEPYGSLSHEHGFGPVAGLEPGDAKLLDREFEKPLDGSVPRIPYLEQAALDAADRIETHKLRYADPFSVWAAELRRMKRAVALLDRVRAGTVTPGEETAVRALANQALGGPDVRLVLFRTRKTKRLALHVRPLSLLALMWVQYALAVTGSRDHRLCQGCDRWFEVSAEHGHGKQGYCNQACKARAYRKRKDRARRMAANGMTAKQIAESVGSDAATVRGWIRGERR